MSWKTGSRLLLGLAVAAAIGCRSPNSSTGGSAPTSSARWPWSKRTAEEDRNKKLASSGAADLDSLTPPAPKVPAKSGSNKTWSEVEPASGTEYRRGYVPLGEPRILTAPGVSAGPMGY